MKDGMKMIDELETIAIEMTPGDRLKLYGQITGRMERLGYNPCDYAGLNLGFELPATWPHNEDARPTLAQLTVLAGKLKMRIIISNLDMVPRKEEKGV